MSRLPDLDEFLDPNSLTPQQLYTLQSETWAQGADYMREHIISLIRDRVSKAKEYANNGQVTAMQRRVSYEDLEAISEAIIYGIKKEQKMSDVEHQWAGFEAGWTDCTCGKTVADLQKHVEQIKGEQNG